MGNRGDFSNPNPKPLAPGWSRTPHPGVTLVTEREVTYAHVNVCPQVSGCLIFHVHSRSKKMPCTPAQGAAELCLLTSPSPDQQRFQRDGTWVKENMENDLTGRPSETHPFPSEENRQCPN